MSWTGAGGQADRHRWRRNPPSQPGPASCPSADADLPAPGHGGEIVDPTAPPGHGPVPPQARKGGPGRGPLLPGLSILGPTQSSARRDHETSRRYLTFPGHRFPSSEMGRWYPPPKRKHGTGLGLGRPLWPPVPTYSPHRASGPATQSSPARLCASGRNGRGPPGDSAESGDTRSCQCSRGTGAPPGPGAGGEHIRTPVGWGVGEGEPALGQTTAGRLQSQLPAHTPAAHGTFQSSHGPSLLGRQKHLLFVKKTKDHTLAR